MPSPAPSPAVSVIIPTYQHAGYIAETLDSVLAQTFQDFEVIVVNDGSTDDTESVLEPYLTHPRLRYIRQANAGPATARNRGLAVAAGEFIAFIDDDDLWPPNKLEHQVDFLRDHPEFSVYGGECQRFSGTPPALAPTPAQTAVPVLFPAFFRGNVFVSPGQVLFRRAALTVAGPFNTELRGADDYDFWFRLAKHARVAKSPTVVLHYRIHAGNLSRNIGPMYAQTKVIIDRNLADLPAPERQRWTPVAYRFLFDYGIARPLTKVAREVHLRHLAPLLDLPAIFLRAAPLFLSHPRTLLSHALRRPGKR